MMVGILTLWFGHLGSSVLNSGTSMPYAITKLNALSKVEMIRLSTAFRPFTYVCLCETRVTISLSFHSTDICAVYFISSSGEHHYFYSVLLIILQSRHN